MGIRFAIQMLVATALTACLGMAVLPENAAIAGNVKTLTLTESDNGTKVVVNKGVTLVIRLEANKSTGFSWNIAKNDSAILKQAGPPEWEQPEKRQPGVKSMQIFRFNTAAVGASQLELQYGRSFEKDKAPGKTFRVSVDVRCTTPAGQMSRRRVMLHKCWHLPGKFRAILQPPIQAASHVGAAPRDYGDNRRVASLFGVDPERLGTDITHPILNPHKTSLVSKCTCMSPGRTP